MSESDLLERVTYQAPAEAVAKGYEASEIKVKGIFLFVVGMAISFVIFFVVLWYLMGWFLHDSRQYEIRRSSLEDVPPTVVEPPIQPSPAHNVLPFQDLRQMRQREDGVFADMGWGVDARTHAVTIPDAVLRAVAANEKSYRGARPSSRPATLP